jgi:hypothetical protein
VIIIFNILLKTLAFPLPSGFGLWNWAAIVRKARIRAFFFRAWRFRFFRALFGFALVSAKEQKSAGAHLWRLGLNTTMCRENERLFRHKDWHRCGSIWRQQATHTVVHSDIIRQNGVAFERQQEGEDGAELLPLVGGHDSVSRSPNCCRPRHWQSGGLALFCTHKVYETTCVDSNGFNLWLKEAISYINYF